MGFQLTSILMVNKNFNENNFVLQGIKFEIVVKKGKNEIIALNQ
jgi:hypothetical protein